MGQTVKELLYDAIYYDEPFLAHAIYYAVEQELAGLDNPAKSIPYKDLDYPAILKMRDDNELQMCQVKLFTVPMASKTFSLYLAETENEARAEHYRIYKRRADMMIDLTDRMDAVAYCETSKEWRTFRDLKRQVISFPYFAGEMAGRGR